MVQYIAYYNGQRFRSYNDYLTPVVSE
ncbi:MAG TPA: hypothetical protein ENJ51_00525 [Leucothrix mucor]|uniref:Uncharacterized protein n=1 Tax=Leucothrix mucor TaxID=45248 RepID=A0A7V2SXK6_LEUMU|nr:hypothetical protein [Leucothrix mucor]